MEQSSLYGPPDPSAVIEYHAWRKLASVKAEDAHLWAHSGCPHCEAALKWLKKHRWKDPVIVSVETRDLIGVVFPTGKGSKPGGERE